MELERWGVRWRHGPLVLAHPTPDGRCVALSRDIDETAASLDAYAQGDGDAWRELMQLWARIEPALLRGLATPVPPIRSGAGLLLRLGPRGLVDLARLAVLPVRRFAEERFSGEGAALPARRQRPARGSDAGVGARRLLRLSSSQRSDSATAFPSPRAAPARSPMRSLRAPKQAG